MITTELKFQNQKLWISVAALMLILIGIIELEHFLDGQKGLNIFGLSLFILGWLVFTFIVSVDENNKFTIKSFLERGLPVFIVGISLFFVHNLLRKGGVQNTILSVLIFTVGWGVIAGMLVYSANKDPNQSDDQKEQRKYLIIGGASFIVISFIALIFNRNYNSINNKWDGKANVYSFGLPLLTTGFISLSLGVSLV